MTPEQYYFPFFFDQIDFNRSLKKFDLSSKILFNSKTKMADKLIITEKKSFFKKAKELLEIPFWATLMIVDNELIYWKKEEDSIDITKINLIELKDVIESQNSKINISEINLGENFYQSYLELNNFVTFIRKSSLKYDGDYYENYVIIIINKECIKLIPFESFNKKGGDYGYVWPAIARLNLKSNRLYGKGMRMSDFEIDLNQDYC